MLKDATGQPVKLVDMATVKRLREVSPMLQHNTIEIEDGMATLQTSLSKEKLLFLLEPRNNAHPRATLPAHVQPNRYVPKNMVNLDLGGH